MKKKNTQVRRHPRRTKNGKVTMVKNHKRTLKNKTLKRFMGDAMLENHPEAKGLKIQKVYEQNGVIFAETEKAKAAPYKGWNFQVMFPRPIVEQFVPEIKLKKNRGSNLTYSEMRRQAMEMDKLGKEFRKKNPKASISDEAEYVGKKDEEKIWCIHDSSTTWRTRCTNV